MFAATQGGGSCVAEGDVCIPFYLIPTPYSNTAAPPNGADFVPNIFTVTGMAHNQGTIIETSSGDEPGIYFGVESGTQLGEATYVTCSTTVLMGGMPTPRLSSSTLQNTSNCEGAMVAPSQTKVLVLAP